MDGGPKRRYIVLPDYGYSSPTMANGVLASGSGQHVSVDRRPGQKQDVRILDSLGHNGPKLVETTASGELALRREYGPKVQIVPVSYYQIPKPYASTRSDHRINADEQAALLAGKAITISIVNESSREPIAGARVLAFTRYKDRIGDDALTDSAGLALLRIPNKMKIERLYVHPPAGYWGAYRTSIIVDRHLDVTLTRIDLADARHSLLRLYGSLPVDAGLGVTVGVIDTGIDSSHFALDVDGGRNCVYDETDADAGTVFDFHDVDRHGTHVAGIIAARRGLRGVAPGVKLRSYRVFPKDDDVGASNFDIMRAVEQATLDGCDIINMSLGGTAPDVALRKAIEEAARQGVLTIAAAGNDRRKPLCFPAGYEHAIAVTAIGLHDGYPAGTLEKADESRPISPLYNNVYLSSFTNVGQLVSITAPGVGICSTVPGNGFAVMSGTSMATPMVTGFAAHLLADLPSLKRARSEDRRTQLVQALYSAAVSLGLGRESEGFGIPLQANCSHHLNKLS